MRRKLAQFPLQAQPFRVAHCLIIASIACARRWTDARLNRPRSMPASRSLRSDALAASVSQVQPTLNVPGLNSLKTLMPTHHQKARSVSDPAIEHRRPGMILRQATT